MNKAQRNRSARVFANRGKDSAPAVLGLRVARALVTGRTLCPVANQDLCARGRWIQGFIVFGGAVN